MSDPYNRNPFAGTPLGVAPLLGPLLTKYPMNMLDSTYYAIHTLTRHKRQFGVTDDEIERFTGVRHQTVSARRRELVQLGLLTDSGKRRKTTSGRTAKVWLLT